MAVSKTIEIHSLTKEMERAGQRVFSLCVGEPDYQPPDEVLQITVNILFVDLKCFIVIVVLSLIIFMSRERRRLTETRSTPL